MNLKKEIRKELLQKRNTLTEREWEKYSTLITNQLLASEYYKEADTLLIYASYQKEALTYNIMEHAFHVGKKVFCPKVLSPGVMEFYEITSLDDLVCGYKNIPEPKSQDSGFAVSDENISNILMIMPFVGFDTDKNRLGYGGGYYDRYLQRFPQLKRIGLGFECQRYEDNIPTEETDMKPNYIITETGIF